MKVYILNTGYLETDKNNVVAGATCGTNSRPHSENKWIRLPVMAVLIDHPDGKILYDTGSHPDAMNGYWPENLREIYPLHQSEEQRLENQLSLCGTNPEDIATVILSHMHLDHAGNLGLFRHADIYVPKADFMHAQTLVRLNADPLSRGGYVKEDLDIQVKQYHLVEDDFEIAPGVGIINLPGHTPGLLGISVRLEKEGVLLFPQDCVYSSEIYGPPVKASGLLYDSLSFFKSVEKVRKLQKLHQAKVFFAHDEDFFKTVKTAPDYYE
jgi:glyoxylase-like metal-dependent hydrolase (beta-lactamase superfamily II)